MGSAHRGFAVYSETFCSPLTWGCLSVLLGCCFNLCGITVYFETDCAIPPSFLFSKTWLLHIYSFAINFSQPIRFHPLIPSSGDSKWWHSTSVQGLDFRSGLRLWLWAWIHLRPRWSESARFWCLSAPGELQRGRWCWVAWVASAASLTPASAQETIASATNSSVPRRQIQLPPKLLPPLP